MSVTERDVVIEGHNRRQRLKHVAHLVDGTQETWENVRKFGNNGKWHRRGEYHAQNFVQFGHKLDRRIECCDPVDKVAYKALLREIVKL